MAAKTDASSSSSAANADNKTSVSNDVDDVTKVHENSSPVNEVRCVRLTGFGGIRMVKVQRRPETKPGEGEVLVRVKAW